MAISLLATVSCVHLEPVADQTRFYALGFQPDRKVVAEQSELLKIHVARPNLPSHVRVLSYAIQIVIESCDI